LHMGLSYTQPHRLSLPWLFDNLDKIMTIPLSHLDQEDQNSRAVHPVPWWRREKTGTLRLSGEGYRK